MSLPSGYAIFCESRGLNPYHPDTWSEAGRRTFQRWKLARFKAHVRHWRDLGQWDILRQTAGRTRLIQMVRAELDQALAPPPSQPWRRCPCHPAPRPTSAPLEEVSEAERRAWVERDPFVREGMSKATQKALIGIERSARR